MKKRKSIRKYYSHVVVVLTCCLIGSCNWSSSVSEKDVNRRGDPILIADRIKYDQDSKSFSLSIHADSIADAKVTFFLLDGDSILMETADGNFQGIAPLEEGYNVKAKVEWSDTTIITPTIHVSGFVIPRESLEKLSKEDLKQLFDAKDKALIESHLAQNVKLVVKESKMKPALVNEVLLFLDSHVWKSIEVVTVEYDEYNYITSLTLKPIGEKVETISNDEDVSNEFFDEY